MKTKTGMKLRSFAILSVKIRAALLGIAIAGLGAGSASADGMPKSYSSSQPSCARFGGMYLGVNGGWAYLDQTWVDRDTWVDNFGTDWALGSVNSTNNGGTAGAQVGYNWQHRCTVVGIEVDANWARLDSFKSYSAADVGVGTALTLNDDLKWFGSARLRTGIVVDHLLLYVTGGVAHANIRHVFTVTDPGFSTESFSADSTRWGLAGGVGAEQAWADKWTFKTELLYFRFSEETTTAFSPAGPGTVHFDNQDSMWVARVGLNYRFGQ
jgi:outer membrane immunogenic protein